MALVLPALIVQRLNSWFYFCPWDSPFRQDVSSFSLPKIGLFWLVILIPGLWIFLCARISTSISWTNMIQALPRPLFRRMCLYSLLYPNLRKA